MSEATHVLDLGAPGCVTFKVTAMETQLAARLEYPPALAREARRRAQRWLSRITKKLERDPRPLRLVAVSGGRVQCMAYEAAGNVAVTYL